MQPRPALPAPPRLPQLPPGREQDGAVESTFPLHSTDVPSPCQESRRGSKKANIVPGQSAASREEGFSFFAVVIITMIWQRGNGFL